MLGYNVTSKLNCNIFQLPRIFIIKRGAKDSYERKWKIRCRRGLGVSKIKSRSGSRMPGKRGKCGKLGISGKHSRTSNAEKKQRQRQNA